MSYDEEDARRDRERDHLEAARSQATAMERIAEALERFADALEAPDRGLERQRDLAALAIGAELRRPIFPSCCGKVVHVKRWYGTQRKPCLLHLHHEGQCEP